MMSRNVEPHYCRACGKKVVEFHGPSAARKMRYFRRLDPMAQGYQCRDCDEPDIREKEE